MAFEYTTNTQYRAFAKLLIHYDDDGDDDDDDSPMLYDKH